MQLNINKLDIGDSFSDLSKWIGLAALTVLLVGSTGCANGKFGSLSSSRPIVQPPMAGDIPTPLQLKFQSQHAQQAAGDSSDATKNDLQPEITTVAYRPDPQNIAAENTFRGQSPDNAFWYAGGGNNGRTTAQAAQNTQPASNAANIKRVQPNQVENALFHQPAIPRDQNVAQIPTVPANNTGIQQSAYQYPELNTPGRQFIPGNGLPSPDVGNPNTLNPLVQPFERGGNASIPYYPAADFADLDVTIAQTNTGRINIGGAYNSDNGIVGQFTVDEKDFDISRVPRSFGDIIDGTAFRGAGQQFRLELVPGQDIQRYLVSFTEPYFLNTDFSFSASGYYFDRRYQDYDENRFGGRFNFGRRLSPDLSISAGVRTERVEVDASAENQALSPTLRENVRKTNLNIANIGLIRDTRDHPFLPTEGSYLSATYSQAFGEFDYSRGDIEFRRYRLMYQRPDRSGRHTISFGSKLGISGSDTPLYENYFAGGFSTIRGFDFRGASPSEGGSDAIRVGGRFQWLNTLEYMFPVTADDMIKGVLFCDFGTIEQDIEIDSEDFRVAPGFGFRVHMPAAGIGAPLAFDFAFPVSTAEFDEERVFSFYLGVLR
jgi:outer membrane protein insertion porin family